MSTQTAPVAAAAPGTERLSRWRVMSYSFGDVANNLSFQMTSMFLMVYMTDIVGIPAAVAGTIYAVTKVWAGVSDLIAGNTVDRANTRWGRLRPWILWGSLPLAATFVLLFSTPAGLSTGQAIAWVFLFDALFQLAYSFVNIPYGSLSAAMTQNSVDRSRLAGARSIASAVTGVALSAVISPQFQNTTADDVRLKFTLTTVLLGVVAAALYLVCFKNTREVVPKSPGKVKLSRTLKTISQNRPLLVLCAGAFFLLAAMFTMNAVSVYYARYVLGNAGFFTFLMLAQTVGTITAASLVPMITVRVGKRTGYVAMATVAVVGYLLVFLNPGGPSGLVVAVIAWLIFGIGSGGTNALMFAMQADTVDFGEWKTGVRSEGGSYSILSFVRKCGQGLGGAIGAAVLGGFGYVAKAAEQSPDAQFGIRLATGAVPAVLGVVAALVMLSYSLTAKQHRDLVVDLTERRTLGMAAETTGAPAPQLEVASVGDGRTMIVTAGRDKTAPVVTFFGLSGSGAEVIAPKVAERLGVPFVEQAIASERIAETVADAVWTPGNWDRFVRSLTFSGTQDSDMAQALDVRTDHEIVLDNSRLVLESVKHGGVILGRNATMILQRAVGVLHVRLTAPVDVRVQRVAHEAGVDLGRAAALVEHEDNVRSQMSRRLYGWDTSDDQYYDLVLNTGTFIYDDVVDAVVEVYRSKYPDSLPGTKA